MNGRRVLFSLILMPFPFIWRSYKRGNAQNETTICKGVFIDPVDVSQMTGNWPRAAVGDY
jgi:hypothetical protein